MANVGKKFAIDNRHEDVSIVGFGQLTSSVFLLLLLSGRWNRWSAHRCLAPLAPLLQATSNPTSQLQSPPNEPSSGAASELGRELAMWLAGKLGWCRQPATTKIFHQFAFEAPNFNFITHFIFDINSRRAELTTALQLSSAWNPVSFFPLLIQYVFVF